MISTTPSLPRTVLALDLGAESVGWALCKIDPDDIPCEVIAIGAHSFDAAVDGSIEDGKDESKAKTRRDARLPRRQLWRRQRRLAKIYRTLMSAGLLPACDPKAPAERDGALKALDAQLQPKFTAGDRVSDHLLTYRLRAAALDGPLNPHELGRALYHLGQRRGFLSNRKSGPKKDEDAGKVKEGIAALWDEMAASGARTLGEHFSRIDPEATRIRKRWTHRKMYLDEFEAIWQAQAAHHPALTDEFKARLHAALFHQRPLKSQKHLIGKCECHDPGRRRAALSLRISQQFRMLQKVNDLLIFEPGKPERYLTEAERELVLDTMNRESDIKFAKLCQKKLLNLPKGTTFNLQRGDEKKLPGNRVDPKLRDVFGDRWETMSEAERDRIVDDLNCIDDEAALARRGRTVWGLDEAQAVAFSEIHLEADYLRHCRRGLAELVEAMKDGTPYAMARRKLYPGNFEPGAAEAVLPPVKDWNKELRNPAVCRALTELRKIVNAVIRRHGKPDLVRIELARDLKNPRKKRVEMSKQNREREGLREDAVSRLIREAGLSEARIKGPDIEKVLLADECNWICPYTGRPISMNSLVGPHAQFDVEHILPHARSLDNSFGNKTLCYHEENRHVKGKRTPFEAYGSDPRRWSEILDRVARFNGPHQRHKLKLFRTEEASELLEGFSNRQLQDTRYTSRLAGDYLGLLFGGQIDIDGRRRVQVSAGGVTAILRNEWDLNSILNDGPRKERNDHRHHAVDALAIAFATPTIVKRIADAAEGAEKAQRRLFAALQEPWPGFLADARKAIEGINVSHRVSRKLAGALHEESNYSPEHPAPDGGKARHIRKPLAALTANEIENIVDPTIRKLVKAKLDEKGGDPKKLFAAEANLPRLQTKDGRQIPIRKARIRKAVSGLAIGRGSRVRYVAPGSNHHMEIVAELDKDGNERKWVGHLVSRFEAAQRVRRGEPVVRKDWGVSARFLFSLANGEMISVSRDGGPKTLCVIRGIAEDCVDFVDARDARKKDDIRRAKQWGRSRVNPLRKLGCQKVTVSYLGEVRMAND